MTRPVELAFADLVVAMIAINSYSLRKASGLQAGLESEELLRLSAVAKMSENEVFEKLGAAGYSYMPFLQRVLAQRIRGTALKLTSEPQVANDVSTHEDPKTVLKKLGRLPGVGPKVAENFATLWVERCKLSFSSPCTKPEK